MFCMRKRSLDVTPRAGEAAQTMNKGRRNASPEPARRGISAHQRRIPLGQLWYHLTMTGSLLWGVHHVFPMPDLQPDNDLKSHPALPGSGGSCDTTEGEWPCEFPERIPKTFDTHPQPAGDGDKPSPRRRGHPHFGDKGTRWGSSSPGFALGASQKFQQHPAGSALGMEGPGDIPMNFATHCPLKAQPQSSQHVSDEKPLMCVARLAPSKIFTMLKESFSGPRKIKPPATPHNEKWGAAPSHLQQALLDCLFVLFIFFFCLIITF